MPQVKPPFGTPLNRGHPLAQGLVGCWLFNEKSGDRLYDNSGNQNHGTLTNFNDPPISASGWKGDELTFDGSDDYVNFGSCRELPYTANAPITIICKVFLNTYGFVVVRGLAGVGYNWGLYPVNDGTVRWVVTSGYQVLTPAGSFTYNSYHTIAAVSSGGYTTGIIDGLSYTPIAYGTSSYSGGYLRFGARCRTPADVLCKGNISYIYIYNRALSIDEVAHVSAFPYCMFDQDEQIFSSPVNQYYYRKLLAGGF